MEIEIFNKNKINYKESKSKIEIHPLWLRERIRDNKSIDINNEQRLYEHTELDKNLLIKSAVILKNHLNVEFSDGVKFNFNIKDLLYELNNELISTGPVNRVILWNSALSHKSSYSFSADMFEQKKCIIFFKIFTNLASLLLKMYQLKKILF